jgi:cyclopropane-fatty-acyl-phospholipid synthase
MASTPTRHHVSTNALRAGLIPRPRSTDLAHGPPAPASTLAASIVLRRLSRIRTGRLTALLPDGTVHGFGVPGATPAAEVTVHDWRFFGRLLRGGDIGGGEAYVDGDWSTPDPVAVARLFIANEAQLAPSGLLGGIGRVRDRLLHLTRSNRRGQARRNIHAHYDLSNAFYSLFLDRSLTYSAAVFEHPDGSLFHAQRLKYRMIANKVGLRPGDHVLEIGCGWGGFAEYAAGELGCRVTGITLSSEQARYARHRMRLLGLEEQVEILEVDYRDVRGAFDAVVSIEMLEAVGHRYLNGYFAACDRLLRPGGRLAVQVITIPDQEYDRYRREMDWIRKYIFPGGHLPSLGAIQHSIARATSFTVEHLEDIGIHYATTLRRWRARFWRRIDDVRGLGFDDRFIRTWDFYLASCEAAFADRKLGNLQLVLSRTGEPDATMARTTDRATRSSP